MQYRFRSPAWCFRGVSNVDALLFIKANFQVRGNNPEGMLSAMWTRAAKFRLMRPYFLTFFTNLHIMFSFPINTRVLFVCCVILSDVTFCVSYSGLYVTTDLSSLTD